MAKNIKGITVEIGASTDGLDKALKDVNKSSRDTTKELREVNKLLRFNPKNTELIAQKQKLLGDQVSTTREKLDRLKEAEKQVQAQFERGEISEEQYRAFQREIVETESKLAHYDRQLKEVSDTKQSFSDKMQSASESLGKMGESLTSTGKGLTKKLTAPALAAGAGIVALAKKSGDAADRLLDLSDITGMSTDSIQEWQHVATVAGVSTEAMTNATEGLIRKIPQLESEGGKATEQLGKLGLSFDDLKEMTPDEQMDTMINLMSEMEDPLERNAEGAQLFGGSWKDLAPILGMGADEIAKTRDEAHELGNVLSNESLNDANDFRVEMDKMKESLMNAGLQIGADLSPILTEKLGPAIQDKIVPAIQSMIEKVRDVIGWYKDLSPPMQKVIKVVAGIVVGIGPFLVIAGKMISVISTIMSVASALAPVIAVLTGPIGLVVAAIAAAVAGGIALYKNWDTVKAKASQLGAFLGKVFSKLKDAIMRPINSAMDSVGRAIDRLKGFFNFSWSLPKLKLPRISIKGKFSIAPPSVPSFGINWRREGGIFTKPTVLPTMAGMQGFAEPQTGGEAILPLDRLPKLMAKAMEMSGKQSGGDIIVEQMIVRDDTDIDKIAQQLHRLQQQKNRGKGRA